MSKFNELINADQPVLVDFSASWWEPCRIMELILKQVRSTIEEKTKIIKIDIDKNPAVAAKYGIEALPTLIIFKKGEIKWRQSGIVQSNQLTTVLKYI
jgi:thioredoxin 1